AAFGDRPERRLAVHALPDPAHDLRALSPILGLLEHARKVFGRAVDVAGRDRACGVAVGERALGRLEGLRPPAQDVADNPRGLLARRVGFLLLPPLEGAVAPLAVLEETLLSHEPAPKRADLAADA